MVYVRKSVWANGGDFSDPILYWYAKGVGALRAKPIADKTSWNFMAAVHGIDFGLWQQYGYYDPSQTLPPQSVQDLYWNQCQHQSWFFLPWHRGYIWSIEALVRAAIVALGGPADWAMPYWNYSDIHDQNARILPPAFAQTTMPDGSTNPLYIAQRYGNGTTPIVLPPQDVTLGALKVTNFTGTGRGALSGFGGVKTGFSHSGNIQGQLESLPHNVVHVDIGGENQDGPGLMSDPDTAGLDPIFWLHHANIDRLWVVWNAMDPAHKNPTDDPAWMNGPLDRRFVVPTVAGGDFFYTPAQMLGTDTLPLDYIYDQSNVAVAAAAVAAAVPMLRGAAMAESKAAELIGANSAALAVTGTHVATNVQLDTGLTRQVAASFRGALARAATANSVATAPSHDRVLLNLENIRAARNGEVIDVFLNLPEGAHPNDRPDLRAGTIGLFGVRQASSPDRPHGGMGVSEVLDITDIVKTLDRQGGFDPTKLSVHLVPRRPADAAAGISVERVSVFRQPA